MRYMPADEALEPPLQVHDTGTDIGVKKRQSLGLQLSDRIRDAWQRSKDGSQLVLPLWQTRIVCFSGYSLVLLALFGMSSFFQTHAESRLGVPAWVGGVVFSFAALSCLCATPLATALCNLTGRYCTLAMGLCVVAASTMGFGHAHSVTGLLVSRGVQGCGMAMTAVSCMSLLLAQSPNVTADMGLQELFISLALAVAPALGGALYQVLPPSPSGYAAVFVWLCAPLLLPMGLVLLVPVLGTRVEGHREGQSEEPVKPPLPPSPQATEESKAPPSEDPSEEEEALALALALAVPSHLPPPPGAALTPQPSHREAKGQEAGQGSVLLVPGVWATLAAVVLTFSAQGFLALALAPHANASLGLSSFGAGLLFSCFNLPYALCGLCMGRLSTLLTPQCLMTRGLLLISLGLAMLGPPPVLVHGSLGGEWGLWLLWGGSVLGMAMLGTGQAWIVMPSLDVMKDQCKAVGRAQGQEEILAGLMNYAISAGAFLGPMLGGVALEYLPATPEARCQSLMGPSSPSSLLLAPHALGCRNGYRWAVTILSIAAMALYLHSICTHRRANKRTKRRQEQAGQHREQQEDTDTIAVLTCPV